MSEKFKSWLAGLLYRCMALFTLGQMPPVLGTGMVVEHEHKILFVERADGLGYAMPGGVLNYKETLEHCILREVYEETGYAVEITGLLGVYSEPERDPRFRSVAIVYKGKLIGGALRPSHEGSPCWLTPAEVLGQLAFDCETILNDYLSNRQRLF